MHHRCSIIDWNRFNECKSTNFPIPNEVANIVRPFLLNISDAWLWFTTNASTTQKPVLKNRKTCVKIPKYTSLMLIVFMMFVSRALIGQMMRDFVNLHEKDLESEKPVYDESICLPDWNYQRKHHRYFRQQCVRVCHALNDPKLIHLFRDSSIPPRFDMLTNQRPIRNQPGISLPVFHISWNQLKK